MRHYVPTLHPKRLPIVGYCFNYNCLKLTSLLFQLTCKFIHTSYDNTKLANAYFMSIFYLFRLYIILLHCCGIQLVQLKHRLLFMRSFSSLISKFQFHLLSNTSEGGKSKAICPLSTKYTLPFYGEGGYFWGKNECKPHLIIIGHSLHTYYIQYFFE